MEATPIDLTAASLAISSMAEGLKNFVAENTPVIFSVAAAFIVFWLLRVGIRLIKSFGK